jgi:DNA-binding XRE family transcriptional regulator
LQVLASVPVETDVQRIEKQVHAFLTQHKGQGEWFEVPIKQDTLEALIIRAVSSRAGQDHVENGAIPTGKTLGERVALLRRRRGFTQADLAAKIGVRGNTISRIEQSTHGKWGFEDVKGRTVVALARYFHVSANYLLGLSEDDREIDWGPAPALLSQPQGQGGVDAR